MPKFLKNIRVKNCDSLEVVKIPRSKNYYAKFWVGREFRKSGYQIISLNTASQKEAEIKAKEIWFTFISTRRIENNNSSNIRNSVVPDLECNYFFKKYHSEVIEKAHLKEIDENSPRTCLTRYETEIEPVIGRMNIREIRTEQFEKIKLNLIHKKLEPKTINNYFTVIKGIFRKAIELNAVDRTPSFPKIKYKRTNSYEPYTKDEIHEITFELRKIAEENPQYREYDEVADVVCFLYFVPLRPGKEFLSLTHNDISVITSVQKGKLQEILVIDPPHRKVEKYNNPLPSHPIAKSIYFNRICKRHPNETGKEFLFFNNIKNRETLQRKIGKIFTKVSRKLGLYVLNKDSKRHRPLYSLRASNFIETYAKSGNLDLIAKIGNTSTTMLNSRYLRKFSEQKIAEIYSKLYLR